VFSLADFEKDLRNAFPENVKILQKFISRDILLQIDETNFARFLVSRSTV
jgi:hypothetical protein